MIADRLLCLTCKCDGREENVMIPAIGKELARRAKDMASSRVPEMADAFLKVPLDYYRSDIYAEREKSIFMTTPLAVAQRDMLPKPYDFQVVSIYGRSLLITRNAEGKARVFLNSCRHRGAEPAQGCGNRKLFTCPYHAWSYDIDGRLVSLPGKDRFEGLDISQMGLVELPSEERHGFIWAVLTPEAAIDVAGHLGALDAELASWRYETYKYIAPQQQATLEANWKAVPEGFQENYHVPVVHRGSFDQYAAGYEPDLAGYDKIGPHVRWFAVLPDALTKEFKGDEDETTFNVRDYVSVMYWIYPNLTLANTCAAQGGTLHINYFPGASTQECDIRVGYMIPDTPEDRAKAELHRQVAEEAVRAVTEEDAVVLAACGRGFKSGHEYALIGRNEKGVQLMIETLASKIGCELSTC